MGMGKVFVDIKNTFSTRCLLSLNLLRFKPAAFQCILVFTESSKRIVKSITKNMHAAEANICTKFLSTGSLEFRNRRVLRKAATPSRSHAPRSSTRCGTAALKEKGVFTRQVL